VLGNDRVGSEWKVGSMLLTRTDGNEEKRLGNLAGGVFAEWP
jgi:hypothetical protein